MSEHHTHIIFRDNQNGPPHVAQDLLINGQEVLVEKGSVSITFGDDQATKVTLTLIPTSVVFE